MTQQFLYHTPQSLSGSHNRILKRESFRNDCMEIFPKVVIILQNVFYQGKKREKNLHISLNSRDIHEDTYFFIKQAS